MQRSPWLWPACLPSCSLCRVRGSPFRCPAEPSCLSPPASSLHLMNSNLLRALATGGPTLHILLQDSSTLQAWHRCLGCAPSCRVLAQAAVLREAAAWCAAWGASGAGRRCAWRWPTRMRQRLRWQQQQQTWRGPGSSQRPHPSSEVLMSCKKGHTVGAISATGLQQATPVCATSGALGALAAAAGSTGDKCPFWEVRGSIAHSVL